MGAAEDPHPSTVHAGDSSAGGPMVVIVATDGPSLAVTRRMLERRGFRTAVASGMHDACDPLNRHGAAVAGAVLDLSMPGIDAECVFFGLRHLRGNLPILLTGGFGEDPIAARLVRSEQTDFLPKPFGLKALGAKADALFGPGRVEERREAGDEPGVGLDSAPS